MLGFGYGLQRLKNFKSDDQLVRKKEFTRLVNSVLNTDTTCTNVANMRYTGAVIDNFVPVEEQQFWEGEGQRYWVNEELWGMQNLCFMSSSLNKVISLLLQEGLGIPSLCSLGGNGKSPAPP